MNEKGKSESIIEEREREKGKSNEHVATLHNCLPTNVTLKGGRGNVEREGEGASNLVPRFCSLVYWLIMVDIFL